jgi:hypothetical protein
MIKYQVDRLKDKSYSEKEIDKVDAMESILYGLSIIFLNVNSSVPPPLQIQMLLEQI